MTRQDVDRLRADLTPAYEALHPRTEVVFTVDFDSKIGNPVTPSAVVKMLRTASEYQLRELKFQLDNCLDKASKILYAHL